ncbi:hypothetical_protein (plasmid) [Leishmania braziliensis MHOM/BR/75/M2904]|uniref:Hypothetical_protein n=1 Tax=Leishmania braziliensis MHOM/BR/75/M2904 TaxID=420245 RepID=A0A3P3Z6W3_LEIBR|nr:hypothetical_protein [Leishmania braziliensis MHOM/BR/75/M2904]
MKMRAVSLLAVLVACVLALLALSACAEPRAHAVDVDLLSVPPPPHSAQLLATKSITFLDAAGSSSEASWPSDSSEASWHSNSSEFTFSSDAAGSGSEASWPSDSSEITSSDAA